MCLFFMLEDCQDIFVQPCGRVLQAMVAPGISARKVRDTCRGYVSHDQKTNEQLPSLRAVSGVRNSHNSSHFMRLAGRRATARAFSNRPAFGGFEQGITVRCASDAYALSAEK